MPGALIDALPVDSVGGALLLQPGVGPGATGGLSLRGSDGTESSAYLDGIPVTPGSRRVRLIPGTNAVSDAAVLTGPLSAAIGNGDAGAVILRTRSVRGARLNFETDAPLGASSLGLSRVEGTFGTSLGRRLTVFAAATLNGQKSVEPGFGARNAPIFVQAGVDTTVTVGSAQVDVFNYAVSRGSCDLFAASANAGIADNYGLSCHGDRTPLSAQSSHQLLMKAEYGTGRSQIGIMALRNRDQARLFDYRSSYVPSTAFGQSATSDLLALTLTHQLRGDGSVHASLSRQGDRLLGGPLSPDGELATRDPRLGFMIGQLGFQYDFTSFPVDSELISNYRSNLLGSRRSPYDLDNTAQYQTISQYRTNAYGATGFVEGGGPVGRLTLEREHRTVAAVTAEWPVSRNSRFRTGGELTRYSVDHYSHQLTSQAFSDVYHVAPTALSLFAEDQFQYGNVTFAAGVRYDRFSSNADRAFDLDTVASSATFNTYLPFPRITSYEGTFQGQPLAITVRDQRRSAVSPRFRLAYGTGSATEVRIGYARQAQLPDFDQLYAGINTDIAITNFGQTFGASMGLQKAWIAEAGVRRRLSPATTVDVAVYERRNLNAIQDRIVQRPDPTRHNSIAGLRQYADSGNLRYRGAEITLSRRAGPLTGLAAYAYQKSTGVGPTQPPMAATRPHTFTAALALTVRSTAAYAGFRMASGTPYSNCETLGNESVLSNQVCNQGLLVLLGARLPTTRQLDLRLTQSIGKGTRPITAYVDARNLFNTRNVVLAYIVTGTTTSPLEQQLVFAGDSASLANEATANSIYRADGSVDLTFAGAGTGGCAGYVSNGGSPAAPNCISLIRAEQRFGNGDGVFDLAEQGRASSARYAVARGEQAFTTAPRRVRIGIQVGL